MQIYIRRNNEDFGPYSREAVLEYLKQGVFDAHDFGCYAGMADWKPLSDLLGIDASSDPAKTSKLREFGVPPPPPPESPKATAPLRNHPTDLRRSRAVPYREKKRGSLIALNLLLTAIIVAGLYIRLGIGEKKARQYIVNFLSVILVKVESQDTDAASRPPAAPSAPVAKQEPAASPAPVAAASPVEATQPVASAPSSPATVASDTNASTAPAPAAAPSATDGQPAASPVASASTPAPASVAPAAPPKPFNIADVAVNPSIWPQYVTLKQPIVFPVVLSGRQVGTVTVPAGSKAKLQNIEGGEVALVYEDGTQTVPWQSTDLEEQVMKGASAAPSSVPATIVTATASPPAPPAGN